MTFRRLCAVHCKKQVGRDAGKALRGYTCFWHKTIHSLFALFPRPTLVDKANAQWGCWLLGAGVSPASPTWCSLQPSPG